MTTPLPQPARSPKGPGGGPPRDAHEADRLAYAAAAAANAPLSEAEMQRNRDAQQRAHLWKLRDASFPTGDRAGEWQKAVIALVQRHAIAVQVGDAAEVQVLERILIEEHGIVFIDGRPDMALPDEVEAAARG